MAAADIARAYVGHPASDVPTPALVLKKSVIEKNIRLLLEDVRKMRIAFRPHVKTLKVSLP